MWPGSQPTRNGRMRNNLPSQWFGSNPLHFTALIIHSHWITFSLFHQLNSTQALFPSNNCSVSPGNREEHPLGQNPQILRTFQGWKCALNWRMSHSHQLPVPEYFQPLCSFFSVEGLSLPNLLFDQLCLFHLSFFSSPNCIHNAVTTSHLQWIYFERDVSLQIFKKSLTFTNSWFPPPQPVLPQRNFCPCYW